MTVNTKGVMGERIQRVLKAVCLPMNELAGRLGVGYDTVKGWSSGRADPSPENRAALATFLEEHAGRLQDLARELRETAE